jgi:hypothetical protein
VILSEAELSVVDFSETNLRQADLSNANLNDAMLLGEYLKTRRTSPRRTSAGRISTMRTSGRRPSAGHTSTCVLLRPNHGKGAPSRRDLDKAYSAGRSSERDLRARTLALPRRSAGPRAGETALTVDYTRRHRAVFLLRTRLEGRARG